MYSFYFDYTMSYRAGSPAKCDRGSSVALSARSFTSQ